MCGIVGIFEKKPVSKKVLASMTRAMIHRGPDDKGIFIDKNIGLGHRRLSIIDLSAAGHQPMFNEDKTLTIVYNGEIYNFPEIKKELIKKKHRFCSTSDTEVIIHAYEEWGNDCVKRFNGMWAFAIFDKKNRKFFISRDRLGIKPLYYFYDGQKFICASEIKAILKYPGIEAKVNLEALNEYFTFQNILSNKTFFDSIYLLEPGYNLEFDGQNFKKWQYWDLDFEKKKLTKKQWQEKLTHTLKKSIWRHLIADVPVGTLLSGGMDSGTIACFASQKIPRLLTFTGGFDLTNAVGLEAYLDERKEAETIARLFSSEHYENVMHSGSLPLVIPKLIWHLEDLRLGMSYPQYYLAKLTSGFVKVALSGTGGDELFGGYLWRYQKIKKIKNEQLFDKIYYDYWSRLIKDNQKKEFFTDKVLSKIDIQGPMNEYQKVISPARNQNPIEKALYFELKTFLHGFFIVEDKLFMAHSMELRVPFTDLELIKLSSAMPDTLKVGKDFGKKIFRETMAKYLPKEIIYKKKTGFTPPEATYYRHESLEYIKEILLADRSLSRGYFKPEFIKKTIKEHLSGKDNRLLIWSLLCFEWWNRIFIDGTDHQWEQKLC